MPLRWLRRRTSENAFDARLANLERVFHSPPLTPELVAAITLVSSRLKLVADEASRRVWEKEQNGTCWGEYEALQPLLSRIAQPDKVLEIGPGMGRSAVFFSKKCGWQNSRIHLYEGSGTRTRYKQKFYDNPCAESFCGNLEMLRRVLDFNGITNYTLFDARQTPLVKLPGPYDLIYSFYSIGFHWSLEHFLDQLTPLMHDKTVGVFTVKKNFRGFPRLKDFHARVLEWKTVSRKPEKLGMLVISKSELPDIGRIL